LPANLPGKKDAKVPGWLADLDEKTRLTGFIPNWVIQSPDTDLSNFFDVGRHVRLIANKVCLHTCQQVAQPMPALIHSLNSIGSENGPLDRTAQQVMEM
jgi:hypothetical protein